MFIDAAEVRFVQVNYSCPGKYWSELICNLDAGREVTRVLFARPKIV